MTYKEIFIQILSEVSGKPKKELSDLLTIIRSTHPGGKWDNVLSQKESDDLLNKLRKEAPGILRWLYEGAAEVERHGSNTVN